VAIYGGRIAYVGPNASHCIGPQTRLIEAKQRYLVPGLCDAHMHVESGMVTVTEFARAVIPHGTTSMFIDPHEIANVLGLPGVRTELGPLADTLVKVMVRLHAARELRISTHIPAGLALGSESQDAQEMVGNLLDNACKWARRQVRISAAAHDSGGRRTVAVVIEDDGPGIDALSREHALQRGARLDESVPGSGLGLAIVRDLAALYEGSLTLDTSPLGGLRAALRLPRGGDG
ncbi:MAG TPA: ATP-binding protein, partial [Rubrivivax sp.]|nr:ATP-binding protein [Rubrivivax sp.]